MSLSEEVFIGKLEAVLELARTQGRAPEGALHEIGLKEAAFIADVSESQMRRLCQANIHGAQPGGFGRKELGSDRWRVVTLPFLKILPLRALERFREPAPKR
ncbi:hypothetical protein [Bradyrhizobium sp. 164]|uniref:hypothetical protein n=1 Tax=Bradyrhizobium sp. 164 TaxID=2782637 RepID=UPI001FFA988E|nr:hypothetical protein [Bradyrhizobium sp. 164]MCK1595869.1 hypothetical protein [Bradyrhizobium sp. 164]